MTRPTIDSPEGLTRALGAAAALGLFAALPSPSLESFSMAWNVFLIFQFVGLGALAWTSWFRDDLVLATWIFVFVLAVVCFFKFGGAYVPLMLVLWGAWRLVRFHRGDHLSRALLLGVLAGSITVQAQELGVDDVLNESERQQSAKPQPTKTQTAKPVTPSKLKAKVTETPVESVASKSPETAANQGLPDVSPEAPKEIKKSKADIIKEKPISPAPQTSPPQPVLPKQEPVKPKTNPDLEAEIMSFPKPEDYPPPPAQQSAGPKLPKYLTGYTLYDITSCGLIDQIPWKFRADRKKSRLILKDKLRYMNQTTFSDWSLFQVLDAGGFATFIFRRPTANGRFESLVLKDTVFNRVVDTKFGPKTVESQDLTTLINRPAVAFYSQEGGSIVFSPSSNGNSMLTFQQAANSGRLLPPVFIRGTICDRPEDEEDSDRQQKQNAQPPAPTAPKAPGS